MASKSKSSDATSSSTKTTVIDRKAVQQRGQQILDSVIVANDDKVVRAALAEVRATLDNMSRGNSVTVDKMSGMVETVMKFANKNQVDVSRFGLQALESARKELRDLSDKGEVILTLADATVGKAMGMAERVARDQAANQAVALEILSDTKTGDYADTLKSLSGMVMGFALLALWIAKGK